jgi:hypothetical protein
MVNIVSTMYGKRSLRSSGWFITVFFKVMKIGGLAGAAVCLTAVLATAADLPLRHQPSGTASEASEANVDSRTCGAFRAGTAGDEHASPEKNRLRASQLEGLQIETSDITLHELFFETILQAKPLMRIDHPQVDHLRGYCYRDVMIVVRQDLKASKPTGWVQVNFSVADTAAAKEEIERALEASPVAQRNDEERSKVVRIRLKPDVPRSNCRAIRLEVSGPEGFMIGFDQFKADTCKTHEHQAQEGK